MKRTGKLAYALVLSLAAAAPALSGCTPVSPAAAAEPAAGAGPARARPARASLTGPATEYTGKVCSVQVRQPAADDLAPWPVSFRLCGSGAEAILFQMDLPTSDEFSRVTGQGMLDLLRGAVMSGKFARIKAWSTGEDSGVIDSTAGISIE